MWGINQPVQQHNLTLLEENNARLKKQNKTGVVILDSTDFISGVTKCLKNKSQVVGIKERNQSNKATVKRGSLLFYIKDMTNMINNWFTNNNLLFFFFLLYTLMLQTRFLYSLEKTQKAVFRSQF